MSNEGGYWWQGFREGALESLLKWRRFEPYGKGHWDYEPSYATGFDTGWRTTRIGLPLLIAGIVSLVVFQNELSEIDF